MKWSEAWTELVVMLRLKTDPVAFRRFTTVADMELVKNVYKVPTLFTFCQAVFLARVQKLTVGITKQDKMNIRCTRIHGLRHASESSMKAEAEMLSTTWFGSHNEAMRQQLDTPRVPVAEAIALAPLSKEKFEPEVVLIFGNPAQIMMLLCGLQKERYERFEFFFIGEGACADSLGECYRTNKPQLSLPCYGERSMGQVADDEISLALPPEYVERAISGMKRLAKIGFKYPINFIGAQADLEPILSQIYPDAFKKENPKA
ncbi:MAG: DUF169 domain-containing protein [Dehalococcoidia bacterium]|nr:DUF169 domain-containing protein [Dehalococcoidia bacterium]